MVEIIDAAVGTQLIIRGAEDGKRTVPTVIPIEVAAGKVEFTVPKRAGVRPLTGTWKGQFHHEGLQLERMKPYLDVFLPRLD